MLAILVVLFLLGLAMGSFLNAMVYRMHAGKDWVRGRSHCDHCHHQLSALDLVPVFSWLILKGRCRYCHKSISWQHPAVELITGVVFAASYYYWPANLSLPGQKALFGTWLLCSVGLTALAVYDFKWLVLPNKLIYPTFWTALAGRFFYILAYSLDKIHDLSLLVLSLIVASGVFWLLYIVSEGKWIGFGDVRLGLITGTLLADPAKSFIMIILASLIGTIFVLPALISGKTKLTAKLPYGPFLILATLIIMLFGQSFIDWYKSAFLL